MLLYILRLMGNKEGLSQFSFSEDKIVRMTTCTLTKLYLASIFSERFFPMTIPENGLVVNS